MAKAIEIPAGAVVSIRKTGRTDGYDGHCLRAYAYFKEQMPDILQADGRRVFEIRQGGETLILFAGDQVTLPDGQIRVVEELMP